MQKLFRAISLLLIAWTSSAASKPVENTESDTVVLQSPDGPIKAIREPDLIYARGIPYAIAGRWEKPAPPAPWTEIRTYTEPAAICPQNPLPLVKIFGDLTKGRHQSEDCLTVTVAAPIGAKNLPVMVYFHGGAYLILGGDLDSQNSKGLAKKGVVTVNVTHRLGLFGYLPIPGIARANLGLLDQIEALRWVQRNIHAFGGDPSKITLFGQSSGADSVLSLMVSDDTEGLFHRAIIQSDPLGTLYQPNFEAAVAAMGERAAEYLKKHKAVPTTTDLLTLQDELAPIGLNISQGIKSLGQLYGHYPLPPLSELTPRVQTVAKRVPILLGLTHDEGTAFHAINPSLPASFYAQILFEDPTAQLHSGIVAAIGASPFYEFLWSPEDSPFGACHCIELPTLLGDWDFWKDAPMLKGKNAKKGIETIGPNIKSLWTSFAKGAELGGRRFVIDEQFRYPEPEQGVVGHHRPIFSQQLDISL